MLRHPICSYNGHERKCSHSHAARFQLRNNINMANGEAERLGATVGAPYRRNLSTGPFSNFDTTLGLKCSSQRELRCCPLQKCHHNKGTPVREGAVQQKFKRTLNVFVANVPCAAISGAVLPSWKALYEEFKKVVPDHQILTWGNCKRLFAFVICNSIELWYIHYCNICILRVYILLHGCAIRVWVRSKFRWCVNCTFCTCDDELN